MFVAVSTRCFPDQPFPVALEKLADLEYTASEIVVGNKTSDMKPEWIVQDFPSAVRLCLCRRQIMPVAFFFDVDTDDPDYFEKFRDCCRLAKAIKVITVTIRCAPFGVPYNEEYARLQKLTQIGTNEGIVIGVLTEKGRITDTPESVCSLCKNIPGLSVTLDPSHFIYDREKPLDYDSVIEYVCHVRLRDTTAQKFQVQIGQGILEYNRLITQLLKARYRRALCVDLAPFPGLDQESELRKMRLLLESIL